MMGFYGVTKLKPDLLFLDINLPILDGVGILKGLEFKPTTIVFSSDKQRFSEFEEYTEVIGLLEKPIRFDNYSNLVDIVMAQNS